MRKLAVLAVLAILGGGFYLLHDPGHVPLFDANLNRLAESEAEGYCAGTTFWMTQGHGNTEQAATCRADTTRNSTPDITRVLPAFCQGVKEEGYSGTVDDCIGILSDQKLWPTYDGGLTMSWSKDSPYPGDQVLVPPPDDSRTGDREGFTRNGADTTSSTSENTTTTEGES